MRDKLPEMLRIAAREWREKNKFVGVGETRYDVALEEAADAIEELVGKTDRFRWIPVTEDTPSNFVSVQAHIVGEEPFPTVREAYVIGGKWFFPALEEFLPVDMWKRFDEPPKEE